MAWNLYDGSVEATPNFHSAYNTVLRELLQRGREVAPRGQATVELQDVVIELPADTDDGFAAGRTNLRYFLAELAWYASRDPSVAWIKTHASLWGRVANPDGTANSNYGEKIWTKTPYKIPDAVSENGRVAYHSEWEWCRKSLLKDPATRQAVMTIHRREHHWVGNKDVPCTLTISFTVREEKLQTRVHMRSSDAWFGLPYDVPFFLWCHRRMAEELGVGRGVFRITLDSLHLYEYRREHAENYLRSWRPAPSWVCPVPAGLPLDRVENLCRELLDAKGAT